MFKWLTNLFSSKGTVPEVINDVMKEEPKAEPAKPAAKPKTAKKKTTKKAANVDLDSMKKNELLAHAKANGIKANASMNKAALIDAIKNG
jgi:hypothetical protein